MEHTQPPDLLTIDSSLSLPTLQEEVESLEQAPIACEAEEKSSKVSKLGLFRNCPSLLMPPPLDDDPIITEFKPIDGQWELNDENIKYVNPETGETILHNYCGCVDAMPLGVLRYLVETKGCDVNAVDKRGNTPIHDALVHCNDSSDMSILSYLLRQNGVNANTKNENGYNLLHQACFNVNSLSIEIFEDLFEICGADINAEDESKTTPLYYALPDFCGDIAVLNYLFSRKELTLKVKGQNGHTLLHWACEYINTLPIEVYKLLLKRNSTINTQDDDGNTPIHIALRQFNPEEGGDIDVLTFLLGQKGINISLRGEYGRNLLHIACGNINALPTKIFKYLIENLKLSLFSLDLDKTASIVLALRFFEEECGGNIKTLNYLTGQKGVREYLKTLPVDLLDLFESRRY
jgi:ankyrin repeat protein